MRKNIIKKNYKGGFTLIEILVVIGIIAVLSAIVLVAINPSRQFKLARDSQRMSNVTAILSAVGQNISEHKGVFDCPTPLPNSSTVISNSSLDIASCLVPTYISSLPFDPNQPGSRYSNLSDYDTKYRIEQDLEGRVKVSALGEITTDISVTR
jgi:prepilin-type N-terminal cleavage/methylation domain-containing protein